MASTAATLSSTITCAAGCFWGTEKFTNKDFQKRFPGSIKSARVGYMSPNAGAIKNPSYRQVCSGSTGHIEVLEVELNDPAKHFEEFIRFFYMYHDPTTLNRQGNDAGTQYASYIFTYDQEQDRITRKVTAELQDNIDKGVITTYEGKTVHTGIGPAMKFYVAEKEHQGYLATNEGGYCNHMLRFKQWPGPPV
jgi:peptide-methionine (S)-S-oxide reductase